MKSSALNKVKEGRRLYGSVLFTALIFSMLGWSCSLHLFPGYSKTQKNSDSENVKLFSCDSCQYLYSAKIDAFKKHFSGLLVIKAMNANTHRAVMITEVGLKVFDLEYSLGHVPKVHYIMEAINKKMIVNTLMNDIGLLVADYSGLPEFYTDKRSDDLVVRYKSRGRTNDYMLSSNGQGPYFIKQSKGLVNKVKVQISANGSDGPDSVKISHYNVSLHINLYKIQEETNAD